MLFSPVFAKPQRPLPFHRRAPFLPVLCVPSPPQHSNLKPANIPTCLDPKSFPLNPFADPHPLTPAASIFYKNTGRGASTLQSSSCVLYPSKSFPLISFADPHHLTPIESYRSKNIGGACRRQQSTKSFPLVVTPLGFYSLLSNLFPCHTSEISPCKSDHCHTSKIAVGNRCVCHTSETPRGPCHSVRTRAAIHGT